MTITRVIDGDTVEAEFPNGEIDTLRLVGVDTPETTYRRVSPEEFEGIPDTTAGRDHLFSWGTRAREFTAEEVGGERVRITVDPRADRRGSFGRLLVYVYADGENFNKRLVTEGFARVYASSFTLRDEFVTAEAAAQSNHVGLWDFTEPTSPPPLSSARTPVTDGGGELMVHDIHADAAGNDHEHENDEYIVFKNNGVASLDMSGWTVSDAAEHTYTVPSGFSLDAGETVTLYLGSGTDTDFELYWGGGADSAIWNNGGDTIFVKNQTGALVMARAY